MLCSCHCHINHVHLLPVNFKQINETNHTYHRRSPFGQKYLCGKTGAQPRSQPCLPRHGTYMGRRVSQTSDTSSGKTRNWMNKYRRRKGAEPPFFIRTYRSDRLHNAVVHQLLLRPERRYRPSSRGRQRRVQSFYRTGCHIYFRHERDRHGGYIRERDTTEVYGYAGLDEPVHSLAGGWGNPNGIRHPGQNQELRIKNWRI